MPYLHWELEGEVNNLKDILYEKGSLGRNRKENHDETEKLVRAHLDKPHPLHIRRTLDQYYYPRSSKIDDRDQDQTVRRYYDQHHLQKTGITPVLTMVDQLWMWVLPRYGQSPPTIITAFPQRSNRGKAHAGKDPKWVSSLVASILVKCGDLSSRSCYDVAEVIVAECSRFYLDSTSNRKEILQFREIYRNSIATIMDRDAVRFERFENNLKRLNQVQEEKNSEEAISEILKELSNIEEDTEDLRQIKDIRDELNIMTSLFQVQGEVTEEMRRIIMEDETRYRPPGTSENYDSQRPLSPSSPQKIAKRNLEQLKALDDLAERAAYAIDQLLELKQKQADLLLTKAIYKINNATDKQGKTVMTFTVVTIIFLPASFMASFLALQVSQFPWAGDKLPLDWVLKVLLSVSVPLTVTALAIAFSLGSQRIAALLLNTVKPLSGPMKYLADTVKSLLTTRAYGLIISVLSARNSREKHIEEGLHNGDPAAQVK
ncbi:hypothetical protein F4680DRAFT_287410 [Xylaria scruposa]|nr:hypothetical protein F4680DRAFT_287410 [Xylaria scruposa]